MRHPVIGPENVNCKEQSLLHQEKYFVSFRPTKEALKWNPWGKRNAEKTQAVKA